MKITFETEAWQMLGQISKEILLANDDRVEDLAYVILIEFYAENLEAFTFPQSRKRKIKISQWRALCSIFGRERFRGDALWDANLIQMREKFRPDRAENYDKIISLIG